MPGSLSLSSLLLYEALQCPEQLIGHSGYRNADVNRRVGGVSNSQHLLGQAADIRPRDPGRFDRLVELLKASPYTDQLLTACSGWLHISWNPFGQPRRQVRLGYYR